LYCIQFKNTENQTLRKKIEQLTFLVPSNQDVLLFSFDYIHILNEEKIE